MSFNDRALKQMEKASLIASLLAALILGFILSLSVSYLTAAVDKNENSVVSLTERKTTNV